MTTARQERPVDKAAQKEFNDHWSAWVEEMRAETTEKEYEAILKMKPILEVFFKSGYVVGRLDKIMAPIMEAKK